MIQLVVLFFDVENVQTSSRIYYAEKRIILCYGYIRPYVSRMYLGVS